MRFNDLKIIEPIMQALDKLGYEYPTPIQQKAIPQILEGNDVLGTAQTGTGKTAAFAIPLIQLIDKRDTSFQQPGKPKALIITPTRELAIQIDSSFAEYGKFTNVRHTVIFGGVSQNSQVRSLKRGVDVLVATPGRLLDLVQQRIVDISHIDYLVLDEADRMLDMGFIHDIKKIIAIVPENRQTLFFSATMPDNIRSLTNKILKDPRRVEVTPPSTTAETISQYIYYTNKNTKKELLFHVLDNPEIDQVLVFSRTKHGADKIVRHLSKRNISSAAIHGNKSQSNRQRALNQFKDGNIRVLVATDIAARGIDIDELKYVINYDLPNEPETYVHRIGRSGRAGLDGTAISFSEPEENEYVRSIESLINTEIERIREHPYPQTDRPMTSEEKKSFEKQKAVRKQEFFRNRKKNKNNNRTKDKNKHWKR